MLSIDKIQAIKTPCYLIDFEKFKSNLNFIKTAFEQYMKKDQILLGYSVKTNHNPNLMRLAKECGMFSEVVSDHEYRHSVNTGFSSDRIIFNGPQKSRSQLRSALENESIVNLDNMDEVDWLCEEYAHFTHRKILVGLRVNFDLENQCPGETTARPEVSRFGFCVENGDFSSAAAKLHKCGVPVSGLHMHYSTITRSANVFRALAQKAADLISAYNLEEEISYVDIGGGFFMGETAVVPGKPHMAEYAEAISKPLQFYIDNGMKLILEPGASVIATSVSYLTKVINERLIRETKVITVDGTSLHINPFLSSREPLYEIIRCSEEKRVRTSNQIICGATCMENDRIARLKEEQDIRKNDIILCHCSGAYTMGFNNCFINLPPCIYKIDQGNLECIRDSSDQLMNYI